MYSSYIYDIRKIWWISDILLLPLVTYSHQLALFLFSIGDPLHPPTADADVICTCPLTGLTPDNVAPHPHHSFISGSQIGGCWQYGIMVNPLCAHCVGCSHGIFKGRQHIGCSLSWHGKSYNHPSEIVQVMYNHNIDKIDCFALNQNHIFRELLRRGHKVTTIWYGVIVL